MPLQYPFLIFNAAHYGFKFSRSRPRHTRCLLVILGSSDGYKVIQKKRKRAENEAQNQAQSSLTRNSSKPVLRGQTEGLVAADVEPPPAYTREPHHPAGR